MLTTPWRVTLSAHNTARLVYHPGQGTVHLGPSSGSCCQGCRAHREALLTALPWNQQRNPIWEIQVYSGHLQHCNSKCLSTLDKSNQLNIILSTRNTISTFKILISTQVSDLQDFEPTARPPRSQRVKSRALCGRAGPHDDTFMAPDTEGHGGNLALTFHAQGFNEG